MSSEIFGPGSFDSWRRLPGGLTFSTVTSGLYHSCGIAAETAYCWGVGDRGALGNPGVFAFTPTAVGGEHQFVRVDAGFEHTCALDASGAAWCWGRGLEGQQGNGTRFDAYAPTAVAGGHTWRTIDAGDSDTCGIADDGITYCWGSINQQPAPTPVDGLPADLELVRVGVAFACASKNHDVYCWASPEDADRFLPDPPHVTMPAAVVDLALGYGSACAALANRDVYCWGTNEYGFLGNAAYADSGTPVSISSYEQYVALSGVFRHCALTVEGAIHCWGGSSRGEMPLSSSRVPLRDPAPMP